MGRIVRWEPQIVSLECLDRSVDQTAKQLSQTPEPHSR